MDAASNSQDQGLLAGGALTPQMTRASEKVVSPLRVFRGSVAYPKAAFSQWQQVAGRRQTATVWAILGDRYNFVWELYQLESRFSREQCSEVMRAPVEPESRVSLIGNQDTPVCV